MNKIEEFKTHEPGIVNMYVCGPTVYDYIHIGNARPVIFYDMLKNYLEYIGYKVNYASNITDVDDKIINKALEQGVSEEEIAKKYCKEVYVIGGAKQAGGAIPATKEGLEVGLKL